MPEKKLNALKIFGMLWQKREPRLDIVARADRVIEAYIYEKNKLIHKKCKSDRGGDTLFLLMIFASAIAFGFFVFKLFS